MPHRGLANEPIACVSTDPVPPELRAEWFAGEVSSRMTATRAKPLLGADDFSFRWQFADLGGASLAQIEMSGARCERSKAMLGDGEDGLALMLPLDRPMHYVVDDRGRSLDTGMWGLFPTRYTSHGDWAGGTVMLVNLPRELLRGVEFQRHASLVLRRSAGTALLTAYLHEAWRVMRQGLALSPLAARHLAELAAVAIDEDLRVDASLSEARRLARVALIREIVAARYQEPGLDMATVAAAAGCSTRTAYAALQADELTLGELLSAQRLDRARERLSVDGERRILDIALDCGFSDLSHFTRRFRERFGMTPGEYRDGTVEP